MQIRAATLTLLVALIAPAYGQILKYEPTKVDGRKVLRLKTTRGNVFFVAATTLDGENALVMPVGHRHGMDNCSGGLTVTKTRVIYSSIVRPDHNFNFARSSLEAFNVNDWKSFGKVVYQQITVKTTKKDYNFFPWAESAVYNLNAEDYPFVLNWYWSAVSNFDEGWKKFEETYESNLPKETLKSPIGEAITILEKYDKFKDRTTFATSPMRLKGTHLSIVLQAAFWSPGTLPTRPQNATLYIDADDTVRRILKSNRSLIFLIDGVRLKLGEMEWLDSTYIPGGRYYSGSVIDELGIVVTWETLIKIANGQSVEFQVGTVEAALDDSHRALLKKLIARTETGDQKPPSPTRQNEQAESIVAPTVLDSPAPSRVASPSLLSSQPLPSSTRTQENRQSESRANTVPSVKARSVQCSASTKKGGRCRRMTSSPNGRCWQHGGN